MFKLKLITKNNSNIKNSLVVFTFSVLDRKHSFWENLVQKVKIFSLSKNVVLRLIQYAQFSGAVYFFSFRPETPFLGKFGPKIKEVMLCHCTNVIKESHAFSSSAKWRSFHLDK